MERVPKGPGSNINQEVPALLLHCMIQDVKLLRMSLHILGTQSQSLGQMAGTDDWFEFPVPVVHSALLVKLDVPTAKFLL
jgi:hypothetical protein